MDENYRQKHFKSQVFSPNTLKKNIFKVFFKKSLVNYLATETILLILTKIKAHL